MKKMIKANELRIGNLVLEGRVSKITRRIIDFKPKTVNALFIHHLEMFPQSKMVQYIPLTEEWLIKFGFKNIDTNENAGDNYWYLSKTDFMLDRSYQHSHTNTGLQLYYVHQLQNLHFALTGEELTIKENESDNN